ncbi:translocon-associated protein subunit delta isoform X3 [Mesocricetus auratus]|uniref:Translocon-associated protein subunit delta n=1 Tax=Mesocricetus auratus TaxID=10036 RepID=A0A3Q0CEZ8_MESAU|nr:translocon-associated protein subunit delta isoform X3 [Mesocricetus auratus]
MAAMASFGALALLLLFGLSCCSAETCLEPQINPSYYTTSDAVISTETVFIVEISLTCKNRVQNMALYADVGGKQFPVTRGQDVGRYQVSWSLEHKSAHAGTYEVRFFDEESYSLLRKGTWNGPWVSTEVLAAIIGIVIYYLAFNAKSHIQA